MVRFAGQSAYIQPDQRLGTCGQAQSQSNWTARLVDEERVATNISRTIKDTFKQWKSSEKTVDHSPGAVYIHESHPYRADCLLRFCVPTGHFPHHTYESKLFAS